MIRCAAERFGGDADRAISIGRCESGLSAFATNPNGHYGVFQYARGTWDGAADTYWRARWGHAHRNIPGIYNARAQAIVTVRYMNAHGTGAWSCA